MEQANDSVDGLTHVGPASSEPSQEERTVVAKMTYIRGDDDPAPSTNLSTARAVKEAQCPPSGMRHGWHPNLS